MPQKLADRPSQIHAHQDHAHQDHATASVHKSLGYWTSLIARAMEADLNKRLTKYGITRVAWAVLGAMQFDGKTTPSQLSSFLGIDRAAVTRLLDKLETQGLIARNRTGVDRRSVSLQVTNAGNILAKKLQKESKAVNAQFGAGISAKETEHYIKTIQKMLANGNEAVDTL